MRIVLQSLSPLPAPLMTRLKLWIIVLAIAAPPAYAEDAPAGWRLAWQDDFNELDETLWEREFTDKPTNDSQHAYLPEQAAVVDGQLVITSENKPSHGLPYRSGCVKSRRAQRYGRWEVRAKLPTTPGMWPALWLLPDADWPSKGEIDFMENRGNQPALTSAAFHWGTREPYAHDFHAVEQQTAIAGDLVNYHDDFHTFAVEWLPDQLRFYVDDVQHAVFYSDECGDFFRQLTEPMQLIMNTAIGGQFLPPPDDTTVWPQKFLVDWVRVYEQAPTPGEFRFANGDFEARGGSLAGWHAFGNPADGTPNVAVERDIVRAGTAALAISGADDGDDSYSGVSQGVSAAPGDEFVARMSVQVDGDFAETDNRAVAKIEFYNNRGDYFGGPAMVGVEEVPIADGTTPPRQWHIRWVEATAPAGAVEARLSIVFNQKHQAAGCVYVDDVTLTRKSK